MLCADCDNATTTQRAEQIRETLSQTTHPLLQNHAVTASFGVTEIQPGDTPETMLRRADRALLMAKGKGRNRVIQLGVGSNSEQEVRKKRLFWPERTGPVAVLEQDLVTPVPIAIAIEKLRGFVADHRANIISIDGSCVKLEIDDRPGPTRRRGDRPVTFLVNLQLTEETFTAEATERTAATTMPQTRIHFTISPRKNRDRRRDDMAERARTVLSSFRSYLMASIETTPAPGGMLQRAGQILTPWRAKK